MSDTVLADDLKPITFGSDLPIESHQTRIISEKLRDALALSGYDLSVIHIPSNRSLSLANEGVIDGELSRVGNLHQITANQYSNLIRIECPMLSVWITVFSANPDISINQIEDLSGYSVSYLNGRKYFDHVFAPVVNPFNLMKLNSDLQAFELMSRNRIDIVITTDLEGQAIIKEHTKYRHIRQVKKLIELPVYSYIHKKHAGLVQVLGNNLTKRTKLDTGFITRK